MDRFAVRYFMLSQRLCFNKLNYHRTWFSEKVIYILLISLNNALNTKYIVLNVSLAFF